jgi:hypothetical protein
MLRPLSFVFVGLIAGMAIFGALPNDSIAGSENKHPAVLQVGDYRPLGFWRRLKLATAPYVNPGLLRNTSVTYGYGPEVLDKIEHEKALFDKFKEGKAAIAIDNDGLYQLDQYFDHYKMLGVSMGESAEDFANELRDTFGGKGFVILSHSDTLGDYLPSGQFVSWNAGETFQVPGSSLPDAN